MNEYSITGEKMNEDERVQYQRREDERVQYPGEKMNE